LSVLAVRLPLADEVMLYIYSFLVGVLVGAIITLAWEEARDS
jgi:hypothetical protein